MVRRLSVLVALAVIGLPAVAPAQKGESFQRLVTGPTVQSWRSQRGYRAALATDDHGDPMIESAAAGVRFQVFFYGCESGQEPRPCRTFAFTAGFDTGGSASLKLVNDWNARTIFGMAYVDEDSDPWLELPVNADGGMPSEQFARWLDIWDRALGDFVRHIEW
jgi:hypothetical protein